MAPKIIFANSRCGSSRFHQPIAEHNFVHYGINSIPGSEYLKDERWFIDFANNAKDNDHYNFLYMLAKIELNSIQDRIDFLELCRKENIEFSYKIKPKQMYRDNLIEWMLEFYKDWDIYRVCRRDNFRAGLSFIYQVQTSFKQSQYRKADDTFEVSIEPFVYENKGEITNYWKRNRQIENETWGTLIYNEDWSDKEICEWLEIPETAIRHRKIPVNYEELIVNIDEVKEWYDQFLQS